jgi:hypothetical protein
MITNEELIKISSRSAMEIMDCMDIKNCPEEDFRIQIGMIENSATMLNQTINDKDFSKIRKEAARILRYTKEARGPIEDKPENNEERAISQARAISALAYAIEELTTICEMDIISIEDILAKYKKSTGLDYLNSQVTILQTEIRKMKQEIEETKNTSALLLAEKEKAWNESITNRRDRIENPFNEDETLLLKGMIEWMKQDPTNLAQNLALAREVAERKYRNSTETTFKVLKMNIKKGEQDPLGKTIRSEIERTMCGEYFSETLRSFRNEEFDKAINKMNKKIKEMEELIDQDEYTNMEYHLEGVKNGVISEMTDMLGKIFGNSFHLRKYSPDPAFIGVLKRKLKTISTPEESEGDDKKEASMEMKLDREMEELAAADWKRPITKPDLHTRNTKDPTPRGDGKGNRRTTQGGNNKGKRNVKRENFIENDYMYTQY